jgi:hypothetical protein
LLIWIYGYVDIEVCGSYMGYRSRAVQRSVLSPKCNTIQSSEGKGKRRIPQAEKV